MPRKSLIYKPLALARGLRSCTVGDKEIGMSRQLYNEMYDVQAQCRPHYGRYAQWLSETPPELLAQRRREAEDRKSVV